ncbi:MAG: APC family permease, partial [Actinomycetota bacterium]|nr:APC family permease [Actinomycetota bacterium]
MSDESMPVAEQTAPSSIAAGDADVFDVSKRGDVATLRRHAIGLPGVLFLTVTGSAPISAMLFNTPLVVGFGNGIGAPAAFLFATLVLTIFSVGYVEMSKKKTAAGGFYSYISHGLGRELGLGTGFSAVVAYSVFEASLCGGFAYFLGIKLGTFGINIPWPALALAMVVVISVITYFDIGLSAKVLGVLLVGEFVFLLIFDGFMLVRGLPLDAINPVNAFKGFDAPGPKLAAGAAGIGLFFAFWSWVGFEMAPNYGEESKDPKRNVPRALYISVIGLGIFYTVTSWASLTGYHSLPQAASVAQNNSANFFFIPAQHYSGLLLKDALSWFIITGSFACGAAFHNTTSRYMYALGREGVLPRALGRTHARHRSPHIASTTQSVIAALILLAFALFAPVDAKLGAADSVGYLQVYGLMAVMGVVSILAIQALVSV